MEPSGMVPQPELAARLRACPHLDLADGPRLPLVYGSAATLACRTCGAWRDARTPEGTWGSRWRTGPVPPDCDDEDADPFPLRPMSTLR